jgi:membrane-bound ClpP family serine protease
MSDESQEMKYEGLAALIVTLERNHARRHEDLKEFVDERFSGLEDHNRKQNGSISEAMEKIRKLEKESQERKLTCGAAVKALQKEVKYTKFVMWIDKNWKASILLLIGALLITQAVVQAAVFNGWFSQLWDIIKGVRG